MDGFDVSTERVVATGGAVGDTGVALAGEIAAMEGMLSDLQVAWVSSEAAPRFVGSMRAHLDQARQLKDALLGQGEALALAGRSMAETEAALAQSIPGV